MCLQSNPNGNSKKNGFKNKICIAYLTDYQYGVDLDGVDQKGLFLTSQTSYADGIGQTTSYAYEPKDWPIAKRNDPKGNTINFEYDLICKDNRGN